MSEIRISTARPVPKEWPQLYQASERTAFTLDPEWENPGHLRELGSQIAPLGHIALKNNAYYSYSQAICGMAMYFQDQEAKNATVKAGADRLVQTSSSLITGGISSLNSPYFALDEVFMPAIRKGYEAMPTPTQLLGNYLSTAYGIATMDDFIVPSVTSSTTRNVVLAQMQLEEEPLVEAPLRAIAASPQFILHRILERRGIHTDWGVVPREEDINKLRDPSVMRLAVKMCAVTSGQSFEREGPIMKVDDEAVEFIPPANGRGTIFSSHANILPEDENPASPRTLPLVCPALHVREMIPTVMNMTIDMLDQARQQLAA